MSVLGPWFMTFAREQAERNIAEREQRRHQLRAWDTAVMAWRRAQAGYPDHFAGYHPPAGYYLAAQSWRFLAGPQFDGPRETAGELIDPWPQGAAFVEQPEGRS